MSTPTQKSVVRKLKLKGYIQGNFIGIPMDVQCVKSKKRLGNNNFKTRRVFKGSSSRLRNRVKQLMLKVVDFQVQVIEKSAKELV